MFHNDRIVPPANCSTNKLRELPRASQTTPLLVDTVCILAGLALTIGVSAFLGSLGLQFGFGVAPLGEDYAWLDLLQTGNGADTASLWWAGSQRNPLAPWWHIAAKDVILGFDAGLLSLRYAMAALLALSTYYMVVIVAGRRSRSFALGLGIVIVFWMASRHTALVWNFQGALSASLLSVATYGHFFKSGRLSYLLLTSILLYFVAIATYTIQCGAAIAIGYLALRRQWGSDEGHQPGIFKGVILAICDTAPYVALFGLFLLIWRATIRPNIVAIFTLHFEPQALLASLREGIWNTDFTTFFVRAYYISPDWIIITLMAAGCGLLALIALQFHRRMSGINPSIIRFPQLLDVVIVLGCIAAPTIALESSSQVWTPGTRWPEIYQLTSPAIFLSCGMAVLMLTTRAGLLRQWMWAALVGLAVGIGELFSLANNQTQVDATRHDKHIRNSIVRLVSEDLALGRRPPEQILLILDGAARGGSGLAILSPIIAHVWLQRDDIAFRLVNWFPPPSSDFASWWRIRFGPDSEGVTNAKTFGGTVPYDQIRILHVTDRAAQRILVADQSDFSGLEVEWDRDSPITFPGVDLTKLCPFTWSADQDVLASGLAPPERDRQGAFRWTASTSARVTFPAVCPDHSTLRVVLARAVGDNQDKLILWANGLKLQYRRKTVDDNLIYEAELPAGTLSAKPTIDLELTVSALDSIPGTDKRQGGVAVREINILPPAGKD